MSELHELLWWGDKRIDAVMCLLNAVKTLGAHRVYFHVNAIDESNDSGYTPLHIAAIMGSTRCIKLLIDNGGDWAARDSEGETPRMLAFGYGHKEAEKLLYQALAN